MVVAGRPGAITDLVDIGTGKAAFHFLAANPFEVGSWRSSGPVAIASAERMADRLDGRPKQATETRPQRVTIMYRRGDPPPWLPKDMLPPSAQPATAEVTSPTEPTRESDLVPMEGPPEGPFSR
jgi:hypothetical protein